MNAEKLAQYESMWTTELHRWALVEFEDGAVLLFALEAWAPSTFDEDEDVVAAVYERMRAAGVRRLTPADAKSRW